MGLLDALRLKIPRNGIPPTPTRSEGKGAPAPKGGSRAGGLADAMRSATLAVRVQAADNQMNAALAAANSAGNPLNNRTQGQPESKGRKYWQAGMIQFWQPGSAARQQALSLQGEARIAKAREAAALLAKARAVFQEGLGTIA